MRLTDEAAHRFGGPQAALSMDGKGHCTFIIRTREPQRVGRCSKLGCQEISYEKGGYMPILTSILFGYYFL
jgi:hypothetical protein